MIKTCSDCGIEKPLKDFHRRSDTVIGRFKRCKPCHHQLTKRWRQRNPEKQKSYKLKEKYGISKLDFDLKPISQERKCAICQNLFSGIPQVDHNHLTGQVRGLLCLRCNSRLEAVENRNFRLAAISYLQKWNSYDS